MRVWDIPPDKLCRQHLLGEHREIHAIWTVIVENKRGYSNHPETTRWRGKLKALYNRHELVAEEMKKRGYNHKSPLAKSFAGGSDFQDERVDTVTKQKKILKSKKCGCRI